MGAALRQRIVDGVGAGVVGVAVDGQRGVGVLGQGLRGGGQGVLRVGVQRGAVGGEGNVFRHHQFDLVAVAFHIHAGVGQAFAQFFLLVVHVAADARADRAAGQGGVARAFAAVGQCADDAAGRRAAESVHGGFAGFLCAVGVGNAAAEHQGRGNGDDSNRVEQFHDCPFCRVWKYCNYSRLCGVSDGLNLILRPAYRLNRFFCRQ